jgi:hypothetical protein
MKPLLNTIGYLHTEGTALGNTTLTTTDTLGGNITTINYDWPQTSGGNNTILSNGSEYNSLSTLITNQNNMVKQVKVAVFTVERNEDNKVISSKLYGEFWVEVKNGSSLDLAIAKELSKDFDPANTVIKELYSFTF